MMFHRDAIAACAGRAASRGDAKEGCQSKVKFLPRTSEFPLSQSSHPSQSRKACPEPSMGPSTTPLPSPRQAQSPVSQGIELPVLRGSPDNIRDELGHKGKENLTVRRKKNGLAIKSASSALKFKLIEMNDGPPPPAGRPFPLV